jgi:DNA-binding NtrC family response regulator
MSIPIPAPQPNDTPGSEQRAGVLVVDDKPFIRDILPRYLEARGFAARSTRGGREAVEVFVRCRNDIDIVLIDLDMPDLSGLETLAALRQVDPQVQCCYMSGHLEDKTVEEIKSAGVLRLFRKPIALEELVNTLKDLADQRQ